MPAKSAKQYAMMQAAAHGSSALDVPEAIAKEFIHKTSSSRRKSFAKAIARKRKKKHA